MGLRLDDQEILQETRKSNLSFGTVTQNNTKQMNHQTPHKCTPVFLVLVPNYHLRSDKIAAFFDCVLREPQDQLVPLALPTGNESTTSATTDLPFDVAQSM